MTQASTSRRPALLCSLILLVCVLAAHPVAEIGMNDDWSYVQSARILANTGHIVYNGWAAPILGWQLFLGALFVRLFGPSFTAIRASTLFIALIAAFLTQRTLVRAGISSRNATIGTLVLVLSPLVLPLEFSFMTDIDAFFCVILCLYACLRALQTQTNSAVLAWLALAALSNAVGGTVRQNVWLGVLVMFPCAIWLLRRRPHVLLTGALLYTASIPVIYFSLRWFAQQPYSIPEHLFDGIPDRSQINHLSVQLLSLFLSSALFLLPILIVFIPAISFRNRRAAVSFIAGALLWIGLGSFIVLRHPRVLISLVAPFLGDCVTRFGLVDTFPLKGLSPEVLTTGPRLLLTFLVLLTLICFFTVLFTSRRISPPVHAQTPVPQLISWPTLFVLTGPFALAYVALLLPRALRGDIYDRYFLLLFPIALIFLLRLYQERVQPNLPLLTSVFVAIFSLFAVAGTHDAFAICRAKAAAVTQLRVAGVADTSIDAGFEHNGAAQIDQYGYIDDPHIHMPPNARTLQPAAFPDNCQPQFLQFTPAIVPGYALSIDPAACGGPSTFSPISYRKWLAARSISIYIVHTARPASAQHE